ncbi:spike base protein, RCAP_Rcc01079 family [Donghicola mangrovi]|uniref:Uncharacterized protein n=1 Tax=Donghicola mangrovi TaxID=2729614 RepID=A0A850Q8I2_9RHOB|nr:hypothetical protein [Donghicola mangrovi]NVO25224.1 hypothetical protein [Donghicola mangrovi]
MDPFKDYSDSLTSPIRSAQVVTPDDTSDLPVLPRALYVGTAGDLHVTMAEGQEATFAAVPAGTLLPVRAARIWATGTAAGSILAMW